MQTLTLQECERILSLLMATREAKLYFNIPVNAHDDGVDDYRAIIKEPMDLGTVQQRIFRQSYHTHQYETANEVIQDIRLVFANCRAFNLEDSQIGRAGEKLSNYFEELLQAQAPKVGRLLIDLVGDEDHPIVTRISIEHLGGPIKKRMKH